MAMCSGWAPGRVRTFPLSKRRSLCSPDRQMAASPKPPLLSVTPENLAEAGFFCLQSKKQAPGFLRKQAWLRQRLAEGMQFKLIQSVGRGFIEYIREIVFVAFYSYLAI